MIDTGGILFTRVHQAALAEVDAEIEAEEARDAEPDL